MPRDGTNPESPERAMSRLRHQFGLAFFMWARRTAHDHSISAEIETTSTMLREMHKLVQAFNPRERQS